MSNIPHARLKRRRSTSSDGIHDEEKTPRPKKKLKSITMGEKRRPGSKRRRRLVQLLQKQKQMIAVAAKVTSESAAPVRMAGSEFFSDRTPQLAKRSQHRNKHSERIQPISPAESTKFDVPSLSGHSNVGVGGYGNDRQTNTASSRMGVLLNTLNDDALRCAESPVQPPLDSEDADAAHHPSVASQHLTGTSSAGTGPCDFEQGDPVQLDAPTSQNHLGGLAPRTATQLKISGSQDRSGTQARHSIIAQACSKESENSSSSNLEIGQQAVNSSHRVLFECNPGPPNGQLSSSVHRTRKSFVRWGPYASSVTTRFSRKVNADSSARRELDAQVANNRLSGAQELDSVGSPGSCLTKKQTEFHLPETVADEVRLPNLLDGGSDAESVCSAPQNAIVNSRGSVSAAESAGGQHTGSQMFVDTVDNEFEFEKEPTSSNDASLANAGLPAQRTDNNVEGPILCDKTTGKRRTTDSGAVAGEAGVIGVRESSGNAETAVPPNGAFFNREEVYDNDWTDLCDDDKGKSAETSHNKQLDADEIYDRLLRHPNSLCTNAPVALLCELVVDLKSTITSLHRSTEPIALNDESGKPTEPQVLKSRRSSRLHRTRHAQSTPIATRSQDKKRQPSYLVDLKADVRRLMHEFLEYPEKDLMVPASNQLRQYKEKDPKATGPSLNPLILDLASNGASNWNKKAAQQFTEEFLSLGISECDDEGLIKAVFLTHVDYLRKLYKRQSLNVEGKVDEADRAKRKAQYARRKELRERRFKTALLNYQHIPQMKAIRATLSTFASEVVSEDEREVVNDQGHYLVVRLDWRSSDGNAMCEILDALHMASHFTTLDRPRPGRFNHPRTHSNRLYTGTAPPALPANLYKPEYLSSLTPDELKELNVQPKVEFLFPARVMRIAARFRHVKGRDDSPLPRNDPSLNTYVEGQMYTAFLE